MGYCDKCREWWGCGFFEHRHHGYLDLSYYFTVFIIINTAMGIWAFSSRHSASSNSTGNEIPCSQINVGLTLLGSESFAEAAISLFMAVGLYVIMRSSGWATCALGSLALFLMALGTKFVCLTLATIWTWGENSRHCRGDAIFPPASRFLIGQWSVFGFQMFFWDIFLILLWP